MHVRVYFSQMTTCQRSFGTTQARLRAIIAALDAIDMAFCSHFTLCLIRTRDGYHASTLITCHTPSLEL